MGFPRCAPLRHLPELPACRQQRDVCTVSEMPGQQPPSFPSAWELGAACWLSATGLHAQDSYEIQVYGSDLVSPGATMVELHSNYTIDANKNTIDGVAPDFHAWHETVEVTRGFTPWFETGFYLFTSIQPGRGWEWVGDHVRPRIAIPETWHWPVGLSLSTEIGYVRRSYSENTWSWELRPIIDKQWGPLYLAFNPTLERSLHGGTSGRGFEFSPSAKLSLEVVKAVAVGVEYYSSLGPLAGFDGFAEQQHQLIPVLDLNLSPKWEINFGVGVGLNHSTDHLMAKLILGRRF